MGRVCVLVVVAVMFARFALAGTAEPSLLVAIIGSPRHTLVDDGDHPVESFYLAPGDGIATADLAVEVISVALDGAYDGTLDRSFTPRVEQASAGRLVLKIAVGFDRVARPGTYELRILVTGPPAADPVAHSRIAARRTQELVVELVHPAARLRGISPLVFTAQGPNEIVIVEESRQSRASPLTITQIEPPHPTLFAEVAGAVALAGHTRVAIVVGPSVPLGHTKGVFRIEAPQLTAIDVPFDIDHRHRPEWLLLIVPLAGALGWLVRIKLRDGAERIALLIDVDNQLDAMRRAANDDPNPSSAFTAAIARLEAAAGSRTEALRAELRCSAEQLAQRLADHDRWRQDRLSEVSLGAEIVRRPWSLPPQIDLAPLRNAYDAARVHLIANQLVLASHAVANTGEARTVLIEALARWAGDMKPRLRRVQEFGWTDLEGLDAAAVKLTAVAGPPSAATFDNLLTVAHGAYSAIREVVDSCADKLQSQVAECNTILAAMKVDLLTPCSPINGLVELDDRLRDLATQVVARIGALTVPGSAAEDAARTELRRHSFAAALRAATNAPTSRAMQIDSSVSSATAAPVPSHAAPPPVPTSVVGAWLAVTPAPRVAGRDPHRRLARTEVALRLITGAITTGAFFALYHDQFVGTVPEITSIAAIAFVTDFSVESLVGLVFPKLAAGVSSTQSK